MDPAVDLAPGAEDNALASHFAKRIRENLEKHADRRRSFAALRASVLMVAQDTGETLTMRFDHGRLTIHDGGVGVPTVTFCGDASSLLRLDHIVLSRFFKLPLPRPFVGKPNQALEDVAKKLLSGELKVYGLFAHPRTLVRLIRILSIE